MTFPRLVLAASLMLQAGTSLAASGAELLKNQCVACHAITKPATGGVDHLLTRLGPNLGHASVKFNKDWLVRWLQNPTVIRPAGVMYANVAKPSADGSPDQIDTAKVPAHPRLSAADAQAAADALMALDGGDGLVAKGAFKGDPVNASMAALLFNKLRGCASCHSAKPGAGGLSGPDLSTAGDRLQGDYIVEYIRNPQKFDPHVWMPKLDLTDADVQKLTGYILTFKQGATK